MPTSADATYTHLKMYPPDTVWLDAQSTANRVSEIVAELRLRASEGPYFLIVDFAKMKAPNMDSQTRDKAQRMIDPSWILGAVYINASMPVRLMIKVFNLAMFLVGKADFQSEFVANRDEALAAVARLRAARPASST